MSAYPEELRYTKEHEWVKIEGNMALVGITEYAAEQLGDVVHVELPDINDEFEKDSALGVVESVKSVSDIFSPVSGKIVALNETILDTPEIANDDPYGEAWFVKIEMSAPGEVDELLSAEDYEKFLSEEA